MGSVTLNYDDGTGYTDYIDASKIGFWWDNPEESGAKNANTKKAWRSNNDFYEAAYIYGINNPQPDKTVRNIVLQSMKNENIWEVMGLTLSDYPVFFEPSIISWGIPDNWGSAAVVYALIEGLAGIKDTGVAFDHAVLAPRWAASQVKNVAATARYEASGGYVSYQYSLEPNDLTVTFTGNAARIDFKLLLPDGKKANRMTVNGKDVPLNQDKIENSEYLDFTTSNPGVNVVKVFLK